MKVKFSNLQLLNQKYKKNLVEGFTNVLDSGWFVNGSYLKAFEYEFSSYIGTNHCIGVGNGLDALIIILESYKIMGKLKDGDHVLVPSNTFIATALAVSKVGLVPILVPPCLKSYNLDLNKIESYITDKTRAIIPVHLYGRPVNFDVLYSLKDKYNLLLIEDSAQAHGAYYNNVRCGNLGDAAAFSFYPGKNLGALGDGGAITTNCDVLSNLCRSLSNYGSKKRYEHDFVGYNSRLDEMQALFLSTKLRDLDCINSRRIAIADYYLSNIKNEKLSLPMNDSSLTTLNVWHQFVVSSNIKDVFVNKLIDNNIETLVHYPKPINHYLCYQNMSPYQFAINESIQKHHDYLFSLPICPVMSDEQVSYVVEVLNDVK